jgi:large subunit ribosomal protein L31
MKEKIHPKYGKVVVHCGCGNTFETRSTAEEIKAETCSMCHPFYTGKQRFMDTAGRIERFQKKYGKSYMKNVAPEQPK